MTIASALTALNTDIVNARTAITNKGGTVTSGGGSSQLATDIATIPSGGSSPVITSLNVTPTTSAQTITAPSGTDGYSPVNVSAVTSSIDQNISAANIKKDVVILGVTGSYEGSGGIGIPREVKNGVYQIPTTSFTFSLPSNVTSVGDYGLYYAFYNCTGLTSVNLSSLTSVSGRGGLYYAFYNCTGLTSVNLSSLTTVSGDYGLSNTFYACTGLTSVDLSSLTTISGKYALRYAFYGCTGLTDIYFRALTTTSFGSYKNQFDSMMSKTGTKTTHTIHFPSNLQSTISGLTGYPLFGGTSGYVVCAFDLPATS